MPDGLGADSAPAALLGRSGLRSGGSCACAGAAKDSTASSVAAARQIPPLKMCPASVPIVLTLRSPVLKLLRERSHLVHHRVQLVAGRRQSRFLVVLVLLRFDLLVESSLRAVEDVVEGCG